MKGSGSKLIYIIAIFIVLVVTFSISNIRKILKLKEEEKYYSNKIEDLKKKNKLLNKKLKWVKTEEDYIKYVARKRMGLVEPGEIKFYLKEE